MRIKKVSPARSPPSSPYVYSGFVNNTVPTCFNLLKVILPAAITSTTTRYMKGDKSAVFTLGAAPYLLIRLGIDGLDGDDGGEAGGGGHGTGGSQ